MRARTVTIVFIAALGVLVLIGALVWQAEVNRIEQREAQARMALEAQQYQEEWERMAREWRWQNPQVRTGTPPRTVNHPSADANERWLMTGGPGGTLSTRARKEWSDYYGAARAAGYDADDAENVAGEMMAEEHPLW